MARQYGFCIGVEERIREIPCIVRLGRQDQDGKKKRIENKSRHHDLHPNGESVLFLADAKYKNAGADVDRSDLYEAYAFCKCSGSKSIVLVYPRQSSHEDEDPVALESITVVDGIRIYQISTIFESLTTQTSLVKFGNDLFDGVLNIVNDGADIQSE